jgi:o-succinylbenzoate synthase
MIHLSQITLHEIKMPLIEPFMISSGLTTERRIILLKLTDKDGVAVWSECVAGEKPNYFPETTDSAWLTLKNWLIPMLLGKDFRHPRDIAKLFRNSTRGNTMAKAALEMASWCLLAKKQNLSLATLLGGTQTRLASGISIGIQDSPEILVKKAADALSRGYHKIKVKIKPGYDIAYIKALRTEFGDLSRVMVDANNAYTLSDLDTLREIDSYGLMMLEQPLAWDDVFFHGQLQKHLKTPICLDESIVTSARAEEMIALKAGKIINIKPGRMAGFSESCDTHDICKAAGVPVWCGGMLETGIGRAYNVALGSLPNFTLPGDLSETRRYWAHDVISHTWEMDADGMFAVPTGSGLGVEIDEVRIRELTVREETLRCV